MPGTLARLPGIPLSSRVLKASELGGFRTDFISIWLPMTRSNNYAYTERIILLKNLKICLDTNLKIILLDGTDKNILLIFTY